jgi:adenylosuccinate lyase
VLWHERDISHSSAERIVFPDATGLLAFMLRELAWVIDGLEVFPDRMRGQVESMGGIVFSQRVLLALVNAGIARDAAYRIVQRAAGEAWDRDGSFRASIEANPDVAERLDTAALEECFDPATFLTNLAGVFDRLEKLPVEAA